MQFSRHLNYIQPSHCTNLGQSAIQVQTKTMLNTFSYSYTVWPAAASNNSTLIPQLEYHPRADSASNTDKLQRLGNRQGCLVSHWKFLLVKRHVQAAHTGSKGWHVTAGRAVGFWLSSMHSPSLEAVHSIWECQVHVMLDR